MRDLGESGEAAFSAWCAISGITANKSIKDRHGWDLFIEFESNFDISNALEMHEPLVECKVQIKSTDGRKRAVPVALSNLKAMATTPLPAFYVLLEFDESEAPVRAFILHIDNKLISDILLRVRKSTANGRKIDLHKQTMKLKFPNNTEITPLSGAGVKSAITKAIGSSATSYTKAKQSFVESTGFEDNAHTVNFTIDGDGNFEEFVKMQLGYNGSTEVQNISSFITRFGISNENTELKSETAVLQITDVSPDGQGTVGFKDRTTGLSINYPVEMFRGGLASWIPRKYQKFRISGERFDIQINMANKKMLIDYDFQVDKHYEVSDHIKLYKLCNMLNNPNDLAITIIIDGRTLRGKLSNNDDLNSEPQDFSIAIELLEALTSIQGHYDLHDPLRISLAEIRSNQKIILNCQKLLSPKESNITFTFRVDDPPLSGTDIECLYVTAFVLGNISFIELIALKGKLIRQEGNLHQLILHDARSIYKTTSATEELDKDYLRVDIRRAVDGFSSEMPVIDLTGEFLLPPKEHVKLSAS